MTCPIPKEILIHSCTLNNYSEEGVFGQRKLISSMTLSNVRLEIHRGTQYGAGGRKMKKCGTLYFDCVNSSPEDAAFMGEDFIGTVVFCGTEYDITAVKCVYWGDALHHLEIELGVQA